MPESATIDAPAPASAPAAPTPSPSPVPAPAAPKVHGVTAGEHFNDAFDELDKITQVDAPPPKPSKKPEAKAKEPEKTQDNAPAKTPEKPAEKAETPPEKMAPKQLRDAYAELKRKHAALEAEHTTLKTKATQPAEDPERKSLEERLTAREKRLQELETELKFSNYERTQEYQEKYWKPFESAYATGREKAASIKFTDEEGNVRQGKADDFDTYMSITDENQAADFAEKTFGKLARLMEYHRQKVQEINGARTNAIEEFRKNGAAREKERQEQMSKMAKTAFETWKKAISEPVEKHPYLFKADAEDNKGTELLEKGFHFADRALSNGQPLKEGDKPLGPQEILQARAVLRNKAAALDYQVYMRRKAEAQVKALEEELKAYQQSEPGRADGAGKAPVEGGWEAELESLAT